MSYEIRKKSMISALVILCLGLFTAASTHAYSLPAQDVASPTAASGASARTSSSININLNWPDVLNNLSSPFQNFSHSLQSAANTPISNDFNFATSAIPENVSNGAQDLWNRFDAWLFGIAGFHIAAVFNFVVRGLEWVLGLIKVVIDWGLAVLHL